MFKQGIRARYRLFLRGYRDSPLLAASGICMRRIHTLANSKAPPAIPAGDSWLRGILVSEQDQMKPATSFAGRWHRHPVLIGDSSWGFEHCGVPDLEATLRSSALSSTPTHFSQLRYGMVYRVRSDTLSLGAVC